MDISQSEKPEMQQIDLMKLNLQQLTQLRSQLDQELGVFQDSMQTLKMVKGKMKGSKDALEQLNPEKKDQPVLVPLTGSMYVPGVLKDTEKVVVDIGTGYYAEKSLQGAKDYLRNRADFVQEQIEKIEVIGLEKSRIREAIIEVMTLKINSLKQQQQAA